MYKNLCIVYMSNINCPQTPSNAYEHKIAFIFLNPMSITKHALIALITSLFGNDQSSRNKTTIITYLEIIIIMTNIILKK